MKPVDVRLYGIIDPERTGGRDPVALVRQAAAGGATLIQFRDKKSEGRRLVELARALKKALDGTGVPLLINDRVDVALAAGADGVHLGQDDIHPADARDLLSRSPKVLQQLSEPEVFGGHAGLATRLLWRQRQNPGCGRGGEGLNGGRLSVGRNQPLEFAPELVWRCLSQELIHQF